MCCKTKDSKFCILLRQKSLNSWRCREIFLVTNKISILFFLNQMAFRNPTVNGASGRLFQHGQHFQDVSGDSSMWINRLVHCFQQLTLIHLFSLHRFAKKNQKTPTEKAGSKLAFSCLPPKQMISSLFSITAGS